MDETREITIETLIDRYEVLLLDAYVFELYLRIALFVQIIVTNCMILGRVEAFASRNR